MSSALKMRAQHWNDTSVVSYYSWYMYIHNISILFDTCILNMLCALFFLMSTHLLHIANFYILFMYNTLYSNELYSPRTINWKSKKKNVPTTHFMYELTIFHFRGIPHVWISKEKTMNTMLFSFSVTENFQIRYVYFLDIIIHT